MMWPTAQVLHVGPVNHVEQVHVHEVLLTFIATDTAWLLQCAVVVHRVHAG